MTMQWAADQLDMFFDISRRGSTVGTELRAGLTSFLTLRWAAPTLARTLRRHHRTGACRRRRRRPGGAWYARAPANARAAPSPAREDAPRAPLRGSCGGFSPCRRDVTASRPGPARRSYLLLVNPQVLAKAGMNPEDVVTAMCLSCGIPTILSGLFGNLPFVMAPGVCVCVCVCVCVRARACLSVCLSVCAARAHALWWVC